MADLGIQPGDPRADRPMARSARVTFLRLVDGLTFSATLFGAVAMVALLVLLTGVLVHDAWPAIKQFGVGFLVSTTWDPNPEVDTYGALPVIFGTAVTAALALVLAVPLSLGAAVFIVRIAPQWLAGPASFLIELLAAIPSIAYGFWGIAVLVPALKEYVQPALKTSLGHVPVIGAVFSGPAFGYSLMAAGIILAVMITPIITAVTRDVLRTVPRELEEGAYGLGATWWQVIRVMLGYCKSGIFGAVVLGLARAVGETMAVAMVIGNTTQVASSLFSPGQTMASLLANEFADAASDLQRQSMVYVALILLAMTVVVNGTARLLVLRVAKPARRGK